jgi:hypothetical protein
MCNAGFMVVRVQREQTHDFIIVECTFYLGSLEKFSCVFVQVHHLAQWMGQEITKDFQQLDQAAMREMELIIPTYPEREFLSRRVHTPILSVH